MTLEDLKQLPLLQTATIAEAVKDEATLFYVISCVNRFYSGDYGEVCKEDIDSNNYDLSTGYGHVLARYKASGRLERDIYIESHFDKDLTGTEYNNTLIMYPEER